jgi:hypothetical protein
MSLYPVNPVPLTYVPAYRQAGLSVVRGKGQQQGNYLNYLSKKITIYWPVGLKGLSYAA